MPSGKRLEGKVAIVTGAGTRGEIAGTGQAAAILMAREGAKILLSDIDINNAEETLSVIKKEGGEGKIFIGDVTSEKDCESMINEAVKEFGKLDILFNNAGIAEGGFFEDQPYENHLRVVNINLFGVINGIYSAIDLLKNTDNSLCLNTSSSTGIIGLPMTSVYSASKHAVKGLTESLSAEFKRFGVKVSDILPGVIDTPIISQDIRSTLPSDGMWRLIPAEDIAKTVYRAYEDDKIHWYVPEDLEDLEKLVVEDPIKARDEVISTGPMKMPIE